MHTEEGQNEELDVHTNEDFLSGSEVKIIMIVNLGRCVLSLDRFQRDWIKKRKKKHKDETAKLKQHTQDN